MFPTQHVGGSAGLFPGSGQARGEARCPSSPPCALLSGTRPYGALPSGALPYAALPYAALPYAGLPYAALPCGALVSGALVSGALVSRALMSRALSSGALVSGALVSGALGPLGPRLSRVIAAAPLPFPIPYPSRYLPGQRSGSLPRELVGSFLRLRGNAPPADLGTSEFRHRWVVGGSRADRERLIAAMGLPARLFAPVDAHARLRGPYTAGGVIVRGITDAALRSDPALARRHDIEIRALVPEMCDAVPVVREALAESVPPGQRTRVYPRLRTRRLAHGVTDFLRDYLLGLGGAPRSLVIENLHHADPSDRELVAVLVRRLDPSLLTIVACEAGPGAVAEGASPRPPGGASRARAACEAAETLVDALAARAVQVRVVTRNRVSERDRTSAELDAGGGVRASGEREAGAETGTCGQPAGAETRSLAARYVSGDGVCDDPALLDAYASLSGAARARLHDARADELARSGEVAARLGAIPYHRERGTDPAGAGVRALAAAAEHCFAAGFHDAVADLGARGRALASAQRDLRHWWLFTSLAAGSLAALGRGAAAEALYDEARAVCVDPSVHRTAAYETAMLYARHHDPSHRDPVAARLWINKAIAFAAALPDPAERAFNLAFTKNGRALIEMRLGNAKRAAQLVDEALLLFDSALPAGSHPLDRCSLLANRARLLTMCGELHRALVMHNRLVALDPTYGEYHFERGNLLHLLGRDDEALAAYAAAQRLSLPFPELHYNRADVRAARGEDDGELADLDRVLELDPDFLAAYINRAGILAARGDGAAAWTDVNAGLSRDPGNPYLLCVVGQLEAASGKAAAARAALDAAVAARPGLAAAWASRAVLDLEAGDPDAAAADLTHALEQGEDATLLFNRAVAHQAAGRPHEAREDAERALELNPGDAETLGLLAEVTAPDHQDGEMRAERERVGGHGHRG
ncbi:MAG TPA: tetratricopeptide repeat protein [Streptosporangiaceae bacterium]|nr:tetratricopeptide repeat protein [Streptosporangiaceae bacterium]